MPNSTRNRLTAGPKGRAKRRRRRVRMVIDRHVPGVLVLSSWNRTNRIDLVGCGGTGSRLAELLCGRCMHVNLLRYSPTGPGRSGAAYEPSDQAAEARFLAELAARGVVAHLRRTRGPDIEAACGQLRSAGRHPAG